PDTISPNCKIKVADERDDTVFDEFNTPFKIQGALTIISPNGGERWITYETHPITWITYGTIARVNLFASKDGSVYDIPIVENLDNKDSSYNWEIPDDDSLKDHEGAAGEPLPLRVRVVDANDDAVHDESDGDFVIDYYNITWKIKDVLTNFTLSDLSGKSVKAGESYSWEFSNLSGEEIQRAPYGDWETIWKKVGYGDVKQTFSAKPLLMAGKTEVEEATIIDGTDTKFRTETHVGGSIALSSAPDKYGKVTAIISDTRLTV
ncbi:unnamed protein product, partial [marine sediment metagenome]